MGELTYRMRKSFLKQPHNNHLSQNYKGEIYEYFAYFEILKITKPNIQIVSKLNGKRKCMNFESDKHGLILYKSDDVYLGEFDIIGFDDSTIYYWEVTMSSKNHKAKLKRLASKNELLGKIFPNKKIIIIIVAPEEFSSYIQYDQIIIPLPDFNSLAKLETFRYDEPKRELCDLNRLSAMASKYQYIEEIITLSMNYYNSIAFLPTQNLIERIYDLSTLESKMIHVYDIEKKKHQTVEIKGNKIYKDHKKVNGIKKTYKEVIGLIKRLKGEKI
jgi:hypothetical protein